MPILCESWKKHREESGNGIEQGDEEGSGRKQRLQEKVGHLCGSAHYYPRIQASVRVRKCYETHNPVDSAQDGSLQVGDLSLSGEPCVPFGCSGRTSGRVFRGARWREAVYKEGK